MVSNKGLKPPKARKKTKKTKIHGLTINDDYSWLRDNNWQEVLREPSLLKPSIKKYLDEENNWTKQKLKNLKKPQKIIFNEIKLIRVIGIYLFSICTKLNISKIFYIFNF